MKKAIVFPGLIVSAGLVLAAPAVAKQKPDMSSAAPRIFTEVVQCQSIQDASERLACFDRTVSAMAGAQQSKDLYIADKDTMREARRGLFGFNLPKIGLFGDDDALGEDVKSIEAEIAAVSEGQKGYIFVLKDGARWAQTDGRYMDRPKVGSTIRIRKAALGSFFGSVDGKPGFRIDRLNN